MKKRPFALLAVSLMTALAWGQAPTIKVEGGMIQGVPSAASDVTVFRGIPYAAPPVGDLRWKRPQPVVKWKGVKVANTFSNICWQPGNAVGTFYGNEFYWKENTVQSEDCLYLNVWTPANAVGNQNSKLPVAFWVHGGAYFNGYGHEITMDGDAWARRGVILVTINYRLGIFGFLAHPELSAETPDGTSGNYGTYDQVAALKWVHDNIAQFGGDPDNITVLGQSAGAASIKNLVSSPLSKGLIKNAIIQSGGGIGSFGSSDSGQKQAEATGKVFMDKFGYNNLKVMRAVPAERLLEIFKAEGMNLFRPHIDGTLLTESFDDAARNQHLANANYMIGCTLDDIRPMGKQIDEFCFLRDSLDHRPAYQYLFARKLPGTHDGAFHSAELWYMFHTLDRSWRPMTEADYRLADEVMDYWTNFVKYGNPNGRSRTTWAPFILSNPYVKTFNVEPSQVYQTRLLSHETEIDNIIKGMTLEEKIDMLHGKNMFSSAGIPRLGIADMEYADGPFGIREEMEPHSWNSAHLTTDSATFFPTGSALAATWSTEWAYAYGRGMSREARLRGKDMILGPAINIQRIPTGGRTYEYLSEDPILSGMLAVAYTKGAQDDGTAVCLKHYALNNQENYRGFVDVRISDRAMHEIYLRPFEMAVREADAWGVMAAYNKVNGRWCSENEPLLTTILRQQWGFPGMVISDWGGVHSTVDAVTAGMNVEMPGSRFMGQALLDSVKAGKVSEAVINQRVREILRVRLTVRPIAKDVANTKPVGNAEEMTTALEVARRSIVLLKNEINNEKETAPLLPIDTKKVKRIAVIGENAVTKMALGGVGAGVKTRCEITPLEGLQTILGNQVKITYVPGYKSFDREDRNKRMSPQQPADHELMAQAVEAARNADLVIFFAGDNREVETEGSDRKSITLPSGQDELAVALAKVNKRLVTIIVSGGPVDVSTVSEVSGALVASWFNGSMGGQALAEVLTGKISPSGKLPMTWPKKLEDVPAYATGTYPQTIENNSQGDIFVNLTRNRSNERHQQLIADYAEQDLVGYRWYDQKHVTPAYPFGHGLSYATFVYRDLNVKSTADGFDVSFTLSNTSDRDAEEVAQVYVMGKIKELKGFCRVALKAGERKVVTIPIRRSDLCHWDEATQTWILEPDNITFLVGGSSDHLPLKRGNQTNDIVVEGETPVRLSDSYSFTEGPAADTKGDVYFTDQPNNKIYRWDCESGEITLFTDQSGQSNGMYFDNQGNLIACADMDNQLWRFDMRSTSGRFLPKGRKNGQAEILITDYRGKLLNGPNDVWISKDGGYYLTDPYFKRDYWTRDPERQQPVEGLYYLAPGDKQLVMVDSTLNQPNGLIGTPDGKHLYVAEAKANRILKYDIQTDGSLMNRQVFADMGSDGMTIDDRGNIYLTGDGVTVFDKDGQKIAHFPIPEDWTANVCFGGKERNILFITASKSVYTLKMLVHGVKGYRYK